MGLHKLSHIKKRVIFYRLPVVALCIAIFWQSSFPGMLKQPLFLHDDKVIHFLAYALLAFLTARSLVAEKPDISLFKIRMIAIIFTSFYGLSDEIHQAFVPSRDASIGDFLADSLGSLLGTYLYLNIFFTRKKWSS
ncbi:MAG: VanZ family protein [Desulfobacula sp.]|nr:VanZ family protein [Desulfobacula sp.]